MATSIAEGSQKYPKFNFNTKYIVAFQYIKNLKTLLCDKTFWDNFSLLFKDYSDFVNNIKYYPFNVRDFCTVNPNSHTVRLGNTDLDTGQFDGVRGAEVIGISKTIQVGFITIPRKYNNFMDYEPYTKVELYVPYFSFLNLPTNEVMGKTIYLYMSVDFDTGIATLYIQVEGRVIMTTSQKLGIDIPIGSSNYNEVVKDNVANTVKLVAGVVTMAVGGAVSGGEKVSGALLTTKGLGLAITSGVDMITNSTIRYSRGSMSGGTDMLASPTSIYAVVTRPNPILVDENYNHVKGKPLGEIRVLSTLRGFTVVDDIHLDGFNDALDEELKEIDDELRNGVYL